MTALCATFFYLSRYPHCYKKLTDEIRSTFASGDDIKGGPALSGCRYLRACIDESLRMSPPVTGILYREPYPDAYRNEPFIVDGHVIPPGTQVGVSIYALHHNEDYFPSPFTYDPERWLEPPENADEATRATKKGMKEAFFPFSGGPRSCAGKPMAYLEASLVLAKTLWYLDFEQAPGKLGRIGGGVQGSRDGRDKVNEFQLEDAFSAIHDGPYLVFRRRAS